MRAATVLLPAPAGPSIATTSGGLWFSVMLLASCALVCAVDSCPLACPISLQACRLLFRQTCRLVFHPVCHSAGLTTSLFAATVSPARKSGQRVDVLSGCRRHGETKAEAGGRQDSWCARHRSVHRVVHPAVLAQILGRIVLVRFPVWILGRNARVRIPRAWVPRPWTGKRQAGVPKGVPFAEQSLQDGRTPGRLVSAV